MRDQKPGSMPRERSPVSSPVLMIISAASLPSVGLISRTVSRADRDPGRPAWLTG
jgi:hypothetical protein